MSEKSDKKLTQVNYEFISSQTQTLNSDQTNENNSSDDSEDCFEYFEDISGLTLPSLLKANCSYPTQLFYTLSPISLSHITCESTPMAANRRQPIGGENVSNSSPNQMNTFTIGSDTRHRHDLNRRPEVLQPIADRPPLIGRTNSSESSRSTISPEIDDSIGIQGISCVDRDALANKVRQLLGKTKLMSTEDDGESLGLIQVNDDISNDNSSVDTTDSEPNEPNIKENHYFQTQTIHRIVHYSSSESEDSDEPINVNKVEDIKSITSSASDLSLKNSQRSIRSRSYSTGYKRTSVDISSILRQRLQTMNSFPSESCQTQTSHSFLSERALNNQNTTRVKRPIDVSKAIQTTDSLIESNNKKDMKETSCQTNSTFGISSFLKELLKNQLKSKKVSVGVQTIRSYLTEQSLKQKNRELKRKTKEKSRKTCEAIPLKTKAIQTSYSSSINSDSDSTLVNERAQSSLNLRQKNKSLASIREKEPVSWFIPFDKKSKNKNISRISRTGRNSGLRNNEHMSAISSPVPLQEAFNRHCIDMRINSQIRINRINTISDLRKRTADVRLIEMVKQFIRQQETAKVIRAKVIQPVFQSTIKRFFTHEEMRAQTEKVYNNLPEVKAVRDRHKQKERVKNQRLLAQIYKYRLKDNVLKGRLTWKITQSCLN